MPSIGVALGDVEILGLAVVDDEVKGLYTFAALCSRGLEGIGAALCVSSAMP